MNDLHKENDSLISENKQLRRLIEEMESKNELLLYEINVLETSNHKKGEHTTRRNSESTTSNMKFEKFYEIVLNFNIAFSIVSAKILNK